MTGDEKRGPGGGEEWPAEEIGRLTSLLGQALSARQIGIIMGRSRNSIIGKTRRLGLALTGARTAPRGPRAIRVRKSTMDRKKPTQSPPTARRAYLRPKGWDGSAPAPIVPANNGRGVTILKLNSHNCHTVIGSTRPRKGLPRYCGLPAWNETDYCEEHYAVFHRPPQPRR